MIDTFADGDAIELATIDGAYAAGMFIDGCAHHVTMLRLFDGERYVDDAYRVPTDRVAWIRPMDDELKIELMMMLYPEAWGGGHEHAGV